MHMTSNQFSLAHSYIYGKIWAKISCSVVFRASRQTALLLITAILSVRLSVTRVIHA